MVMYSWISQSRGLRQKNEISGLYLKNTSREKATKTSRANTIQQAQWRKRESRCEGVEEGDPSPRPSWSIPGDPVLKQSILRQSRPLRAESWSTDPQQCARVHTLLKPEGIKRPLVSRALSSLLGVNFQLKATLLISICEKSSLKSYFVVKNRKKDY